MLFPFGRTRAVTVADHILVLARDGGIGLDPLQLNKLCYITQGFCLGESGKPAFGDSIEAWKYGPVVKSVYHKFRQYERVKITHLADNTPLNHDERRPSPEDHAVYARLPPHAVRAAERVVSKYGKYGGIELLNMTHYEGTPWHKVYSPCRNNVIPVDLIRKHYERLVVIEPNAGL